jgi:RNA polymerase sigma-70 factor (ECF subfamily)
VHDDVSSSLDHLFRRRYGYVVATLTRVFGIARLDLVEDAVQDAHVAALRRWPHHGVPENPTAWLIQVAKNRVLDRLRRRGRWEASGEAADAIVAPESAADAAFADELTDDQLRMIFACCDPSVPRDGQIALTLRSVCGFSTNEVARAFLSGREAAAKTLVRAKARLREQGVRFEIPPPAELPERLDAVLAVVYLTFNEGYSAHEGEKLVRAEVCAEAIRLCELLADHPATASPRVHALSALLLFQGARLAARTDDAGDLLVLADQDRSAWDRGMIGRGLERMRRSAAGDVLSAYHLEAEIAMCHAVAPSADETDWPRVLGCYDALLALKPSPVVALNRVVALWRVAGASSALAEIDRLTDHRSMRGYLPLHATRGELLAETRDFAGAAAAFRRASELTSSAPVRRHLARRLDWVVARC